MKSFHYPLSIGLLLIWSGWTPPSNAQIIPDRTLNPESSRLQRQGNTITINGGANREPLLFHSFEQFSIPDDQSVFFTNPPDVHSILSRVTGNSPSNIDGTLGVLGAADLFLLNPNGILFGPNAQLNIAGSFTVSTGDRLTLDAFDFSAVDPTPVPLLTLDITPGIQLGTARSGRIQNQATLTLPSRQSLTFNGGSIEQSGQITIPRGTVDLRGKTLNLTGDINTRTTDNQLGVVRLSSPDNLTIAATAPLTNQAIAQALQNNQVVVESDRNLSLVGALSSPSPAPLTLISGNDLSLLPNNGDGIVQLNGDAILQSGNDILIEHQLFVTSLSFSSGNEGVNDLRPRSITLQANGDIQIRDTPTTTSRIPSGQQHNMLLLEGNQGNQGRLSIRANSLTMENSGFVRTNAGVKFLVLTSTITGDGQRGGDVDIVLAEDLTLDSSSIYVTAGNGQDSGNLSIDVGGSVRLIENSGLLTGHYVLNSLTGETGNIDIRADETVFMQGSVIRNNSFSQVGDITVTAANIIMDASENPTSLYAGTDFLSPNNAGNVTVNASEFIEIIGRRPASDFFLNPQETTIDDLRIQGETSAVITATALGTGESGRIEVNTNQLRLREGAVIVNAIGGLGNSSGTRDVVINADDIHLIGASGIGSGTLGTTDAGRLEINSDRIRLEDNSVISVSTVFGGGDAGKLVIHTDELVVTGGSAIAANSGPNGGGNGHLDIQAQTITIDGISADGGFSSSVLTDVDATATGPGGPLNIRTGILKVLNGGQIRASTQGAENAGNLRISADNVALSGTSPNGIPSTIEAQSIGAGEAGDIRLTADRLAIRDGAAVNTRSLQGNGGNIRLGIDEVLLLRRDGQISSEAGLDEIQGEDSDIPTDGDGGNITINAGFVVSPALENSDITANASGGNGGDIDITTNALLLGIAPRSQSTSFSDITASSGPGGVDGTITIAGVVDDLGPEPLDLPSGLVAEGDRIATGCLLDENASFIVTGRGGIPANSRDILSQVLFWDDSRISDEMRSDVIQAKYEQANNSTSNYLSKDGEALHNSVESTTQALSEARGWQVNDQGQFEFVAMADRPVISHPTCHDSLS